MQGVPVPAPVFPGIPPHQRGQGIQPRPEDLLSEVVGDERNREEEPSLATGSDGFEAVGKGLNLFLGVVAVPETPVRSRAEIPEDGARAAKAPLVFARPPEDPVEGPVCPPGAELVVVGVEPGPTAGVGSRQDEGASRDQHATNLFENSGFVAHVFQNFDERDGTKMAAGVGQVKAIVEPDVGARAARFRRFDLCRRETGQLSLDCR